MVSGSLRLRCVPWPAMCAMAVAQQYGCSRPPLIVIVTRRNGKWRIGDMTVTLGCDISHDFAATRHESSNLRGSSRFPLGELQAVHCNEHPKGIDLEEASIVVFLLGVGSILPQLVRALNSCIAPRGRTVQLL